MSDKVFDKWFVESMTEKTKQAFDSDYLDTKNNKSKHIRNLFKDWDDVIYGHELLKYQKDRQLYDHVGLYQKHLQKHIEQSNNLSNNLSNNTSNK